jgi:sugar/nucleoside kinase (ribokinase family)
MRVLVAGGVSFDSIVYLRELPRSAPHTVFSKGFYETVGSTGAGKALNLNRLNFDVTLHALIGDDVPGTVVQTMFERERLRFLYDIDPQGTERHINLMADSGDRISIYAAHATFEPAVNMAQVEAEMSRCDVLALNIINYCRHLIPLAKQYGKPIWCDIHDYDGKNPYHQDFIDAADYLFMSSDAMRDYRAFMQAMIDAGKRLVVCTHGKAGVTALTAAGEWLETPALTSYQQVDTNGAGDACFAGYLYGHAQGYPAARCLQLGVVAGGLTVTARELVHPQMSAALLEAEWQRHFA